MYIKPLQYIIFIFLWYPVLRMASKEVDTTHIMDTETLDENKTNLKMIKHLKKDSNCKVSDIRSDETQTSMTEYISTDVCLIFLCHLTTRRSTECVLATTALFFWKVSAFPVNCISSADCTRENGARKSRSVSTNNEFDRGECEKDWFKFDGKCFQLTREIMNYNLADKHCQSLESALANIETMEQNTFVRNLANNFGISGYLWTGVKRLCKNCTRTVAGYMNWLPKQRSGVSKCVTMNPDGLWQDFDCAYMFAFVCVKVLRETYTKTQLLVALLVPIISCLTIAISFTAVLLVSSVRRVNQPFKVASRYRSTKKERKPTTWVMVDMLRRTSLSRRGSRLKPQRGSAPSIEITKAAEDINGKVVSNGEDKKKPWYKRGGNENKKLKVPEERRRSSNSSSTGNSSLYELLARLNKMEFEPPIETSFTETDEVNSAEAGIGTIENIQMKQLSENKNGLKPQFIEDDCGLSGSDKQLVQKQQNTDDTVHSQVSFRNMAFRDSVVSVEADGSGIAKVISVQQVNQRDSMTKLENIQNITSEAEHHELGSPESPCTSSHSSRGEKENETSGNTQTVRADVHQVSDSTIIPARNGTDKKQTVRKPSKGKVIWTYSL
ncbi:uncharacterized protein LOC114530304 [Dendronephthya gigantea]|uniref:uncharacterized protein LOC114530304 n=1 Tax=Dendronephthya gigantea TaxID=151771 RepID=UPI00106A445E|nr:uncharacterized protein LOC114530304 [Dendronephthya gigantea]